MPENFVVLFYLEASNSFLSSLRLIVICFYYSVASFVILEKIHLARDVRHPCWFLISLKFPTHPQDEGNILILLSGDRMFVNLECNITDFLLYDLAAFAFKLL